MPDTVSASSKARTKKSQTVEEQLHDSLDSPGEVGVKLSATDGIELMLAKINGLQREVDSLRRNSVVESSALSLEKSMVSDLAHSGTQTLSLPDRDLESRLRAQLADTQEKKRLYKEEVRESRILLKKLAEKFSLSESGN